MVRLQDRVLMFVAWTVLAGKNLVNSLYALITR